MSRDKRDGFIFYASFLEAVKELPSEVREETILTILEYGISGIELEPSNPITKAIFMLVKPQIDANYKRYENGKKGGVYGKEGGRPINIETLKQPQKQTNKTAKEKGNEEKKVKFDFKVKLMELINDEGLVDDFIELRKKKKAVNSESALKMFVNECEKHNYPIIEAVKICIQRNWQGFKYSWIMKDETPIEGGKGHIAGLNAAAQMRMPEN